MRCLKTVEYLREGENNRARPHTAQSDHHCLYRELKMHSHSSKKQLYAGTILSRKHQSKQNQSHGSRSCLTKGFNSHAIRAANSWGPDKRIERHVSSCVLRNNQLACMCSNRSLSQRRGSPHKHVVNFVSASSLADPRATCKSPLSN